MWTGVNSLKISFSMSGMGPYGVGAVTMGWIMGLGGEGLTRRCGEQPQPEVAVGIYACSGDIIERQSRRLI